LSSAQRSGGSAAASGVRYENLVGAWYAAQAIVGVTGAPLLDLPADVSVVSVRSQTEAPVDDLLAETSAGGFIFVQCKRKVQLGSSAGSALAAAFNQFVLQWIVCNQSSESRSWARPLQVARDRLVLATSAESSAAVRTTLPRLLQKLRDAAPGATLPELADNEQERNAAAQIETIIRQSFAERLDRDPTPDELSAILLLIWIQVLDVEDGRADARAACETLANAALVEPAQAPLAWSALTQLMNRFSVQRTGAAAATLRAELTSAGVRLRSPRTYAGDIETLSIWTRDKLDQGAAFTRLVASDPNSAIVREVFGPLKSAATAESYLVTGEPGSGKSGVIYELAQSLVADGHDVLFLPVDRLPVSGGAQLIDELRVSHDLVEILRNWEGQGNAYLVIDALDAARNFGTQVVFRELVSAVLALGGRWHVIASVRKYDLRFGMEWRSLFAGDPPAPSFRDPEFARIRHIAIPQLSLAEIQAAATYRPRLNDFLAQATPSLRELLRTVFNLHLLSQLLEDGAASAALSTIRTQLDLLDRWWQHRISRSDHRHDVRERALAMLLEAMIATRSLQIMRGRFRANAGLDLDVLADLEAHGVLRTTDTTGATQSNDRIQFAHHILFDYAVERITFMRGLDPAAITNRLAIDRDLALVLRPSLHLVFQDTWALAPPRAAFWTLSFALGGHSGIPEVAKLAAPMVAAENARPLNDLAPLLARLPQHALDLDDEPARRFLGHLLGALLVLAAAGRALTGPDSGPWCELAAALATRNHRSMMFNLRTLVWKLSEHPEQWTEPQKNDVGRASRTLLAYVWTPGNYDGNVVVNAIDAVLKTFGTDLEASRALLRRALDPDHMAAHAFAEMSWIARGVPQIARFDPDLVVELYTSAFAFREQSDAKTSMGESQILPLTSNRRQDFEMTWFQLSEEFPKFIAAHPRQGIRALGRAIEGYLQRERETPNQSAEFAYAGHMARIAADHSYSWRQFRHYRDALTLLPGFDAWLNSLASNSDAAETFANALSLVAEESALAGIWATMIAAAARHPEAFGRPIASLLTIPEILASVETTHDIGLALPAIYPHLATGQRAAIESAILALDGKLGQRARSILLGTIPEGQFETAEARTARDAAATEKTLQPNRRPVEFTSSSGIYDSRAFLRDEGVDVESDQAKRFLDLEDQAQAFAAEHLNAIPKAAALKAAWPPVEALWAEFRAQEVHGEPRLLEHALSVAAEAAARAARADLSEAGLQEIHARVREILLRAEHGQSPELRPDIEEQFNSSVSWGSPSARIEAAQGIMGLLQRRADDEMLAAATRLAQDPVAAVRWHIIHRVFVLIATKPDFVWQIATYVRDEEDNRGVIAGFLGEILPRLISVDRTGAIDLAEFMVVRFRDDARPGADQCLEYVLSVLWDLLIWEDEPRAHAIVYRSLETVHDYADQLHALIGRQRPTLTVGAIDNPADKAHGARDRVFALFNAVAKRSYDRVSELFESHKGVAFNAWPENDQDDTRDRFRILDLITRELFFASGAYSGNSYPSAPAEPPNAIQTRFYRQALPLFTLLSKVLAAPVAHHLIETLEFFIPVSPAEVFRLVAASIRTAEAGGYTLEHMGSGLFVRIVERYLADYRDVFSDESLRGDLLDSLDAFVRAGWPDARALTFKIADIWR
jgi:hypothetical protein